MSARHMSAPLRRRLVAALASSVLALGVAAGVAAPAEAATGTGYVTACFVATTGGYTGPVQSAPAILEWWNGTTWVSSGSWLTNNRGCVTVNVYAGYSYHYRMDWYTKPLRVVGTSPWITVYAGQSVNVGTTTAVMLNVG